MRILLIAFALSVSSLSSSEEKITYGERWNLLNDSEKTLYIAGYRDGWVNLSDLIKGKHPSLKQPSDIVLRDLSTDIYSLSLDRFYKDKNNEKIHYGQALWIARLDYDRAWSKEEREKYLEITRKHYDKKKSNRLKKGVESE
ncbi:hypothetical protein [Agarilytica rhodophyticola]|uniref:hypothetical protein n=1 Tax=Agarilytica rhodophyticola TaxID=1737490 RepID=UPI001315581C|nr:hypothetical protein [Agarilytica rhodophyticola]